MALKFECRNHRLFTFLDELRGWDWEGDGSEDHHDEDIDQKDETAVDTTVTEDRGEETIEVAEKAPAAKGEIVGGESQTVTTANRPIAVPEKQEQHENKLENMVAEWIDTQWSAALASLRAPSVDDFSTFFQFALAGGGLSYIRDRCAFSFRLCGNIP